jgi:hypothetical protein
MKRQFIIALSFMLAFQLAMPAEAQIGTPGTGPLTPGGPRRGLGPPSLRDNVPDLRLHSEEGGIPGAGPPIDYGRGYGRAQPPGGYGLEQRYRIIDRPAGRASGLNCQTPRRVCALANLAPVGARCSCRLPRGRARGEVVP